LRIGTRWLRFKEVNDIVFEVTQESDGGFCAECLTESIFSQGDTWDELRANVKKAVEAFYFDRPKPNHIRLHLVRDEMLASDIVGQAILPAAAF
jgi:predicted RNase H-like HicB family nuclease